MKIKKRLIAWFCCELVVVTAVLAYTPAHSQSTAPVPSAPAVVPVQQGAPAHPASSGGVATGGRTGASGAAGRAANTASSRRQYGAAPTVLVDPAALANGAYNSGSNSAATQAPIPSPFPASARGKNGKNVITTETVTSDSVR